MPARAGATSFFKVGFFTKTNVTPAPVAQTVAHGLGATPKAIILWTNYQSSNYRFAVGFSDGTNSGSMSCASENNKNPSVTAQRGAAKALSIVEFDQTVLAEADVTSVDATNINLNWTTNSTVNAVIWYLAIGGTDVSAKVRNFTTRTTTGNQSITGVGFAPNIILNLYASSALTALGSLPNGAIGMGAAGGANQWASHMSADNGVSPSNTVRGQRTDAALYLTTNALGVAKKAALASMDADGFTLNYSTVDANATQVYTLALKGVEGAVGNFAKSTNTSVPVIQSVSGIGFTPSMVILSGFETPAQASPVANARFLLGASDGTTSECVGISDDSGVSKTAAATGATTADWYWKMDTSVPTIDAKASFSSFSSGAFALDWYVNDAVASQILYLALGSLSPTLVRLSDLRAVADARGTTISWHEEYADDLLGFNVYREENGTRTQLNPTTIYSSSLDGDPSRTDYSWLDEMAPEAAPYWVETVKLDGTSLWDGPVATTSATQDDLGAAATTVTPINGDDAHGAGCAMTGAAITTESTLLLLALCGYWLRARFARRAARK
jgi:hypothetical protein